MNCQRSWRPESRLKKIARPRRHWNKKPGRAVAEKALVEAKLEERRRQEEARGKKFGGRRRRCGSEQAKPDRRRNGTSDPESRIMLDGATKSFIQAYNVQAAVDSQEQIIVAAALTQEANDKKQLVPMLEQVEQNMAGSRSRPLRIRLF